MRFAAQTAGVTDDTRDIDLVIVRALAAEALIS